MGEWFYYKYAVHKIYDEQTNNVLNELKLAMPQSMFGFRFFNNKSDINISIYRNKVLIYGHDVRTKNSECWMDNNIIYCHYELPRRWGKIEFVGYKRFDLKPVTRLKKELFIFSVVVLTVIILIAFILGKIFLKPVKDAILSLENFIRDATHEMNTPISIINTNMEMLEMKNITYIEFERIKSATDRLEKIFKDLTYVRINHEIKTKNIQKLNICELIEKRLNIFETIIDKKKIKMIKICENIFIKADKEDIIRIIDNLFSNAFKYAPINTEVQIILKNGILKVSNQGEIKNIKKITEKFYRENKSEGGFGLGLYIVRKICNYYGFEFNIENKNRFVQSSVKFSTFIM